jgi:hypothetical protein
MVTKGVGVVDLNTGRCADIVAGNDGVRALQATSSAGAAAKTQLRSPAGPAM